ncbi:hypothetical protein [[Kitasatospora] papulosa]|uniref:hypothetical protein n=1 Tax=[Kitasatospora] papulosa TaxID=1464011 RepID=UPI003673F565
MTGDQLPAFVPAPPPPWPSGRSQNAVVPASWERLEGLRVRYAGEAQRAVRAVQDMAVHARAADRAARVHDELTEAARLRSWQVHSRRYTDVLADDDHRWPALDDAVRAVREGLADCVLTPGRYTLPPDDNEHEQLLRRLHEHRGLVAFCAPDALAH